ncbi:Bromodomain adjacent to zinc finger domain protein 2B [Rhizophlyctis rosea]|nr:Bromodomain adjacent to zinc finger domain protein 2B [Rhizophlyctis rosea]
MENASPFPIAQTTKVVPVDDDDPRIGLRGHTKVIASKTIEKNQIIGIYEGEVLFEMEHHSNVLNRIERENKSIDYDHFEKLEHDIEEEYAIYFGLNKGHHIGDGMFRFSDPLICDGTKAKGYFQWTTEVNDCRQDPFTPVARRGKEVLHPNVSFVEVLILGWPYIFLMAKEEIPFGSELTLDYSEGYWVSNQHQLRDLEIVRNLVQPVKERMTSVDERLAEGLARQQELLQSLQTISGVLQGGLANGMGGADGGGSPTFLDGTLRDLLQKLRKGSEMAEGQMRDFQAQLQAVDKLLEPYRGNGSLVGSRRSSQSIAESLDWARNAERSLKEESETLMYLKKEEHNSVDDLYGNITTGADPLDVQNNAASPSREMTSPPEVMSTNDSTPHNPTPEEDASEPLISTLPDFTTTNKKRKRADLTTETQPTTPNPNPQQNLHKPRHHQKNKDASPFLTPVDTNIYHWYNDVISTPMDFSTIKHKLLSNTYTSIPQFAHDVMLVFENCMAFNERGSVMWKIADRMKCLCLRRFEVGIVFCRGCGGVQGGGRGKEGKGCEGCGRKVGRRQKGVMNMQDVRKRVLGVGVGERVLAQWPDTAVFYPATVLDRAEDFSTYRVRFNDQEMELGHQKILVFPDPDYESGPLPTNARVLAPLPAHLDEWKEDDHKYVPGIVKSSSMERVTVWFERITQVTSEVAASDVVKIDQEFYQQVLDEMNQKAEEQRFRDMGKSSKMGSGNGVSSGGSGGVIARKGRGRPRKSTSVVPEEEEAEMKPTQMVIETVGGWMGDLSGVEEEEVPLERSRSPKKKRKVAVVETDEEEGGGGKTGQVGGVVSSPKRVTGMNGETVGSAKDKGKHKAPNGSANTTTTITNEEASMGMQPIPVPTAKWSPDNDDFLTPMTPAPGRSSQMAPVPTRGAASEPVKKKRPRARRVNATPTPSVETDQGGGGGSQSGGSQTSMASESQSSWRSGSQSGGSQRILSLKALLVEEGVEDALDGKKEVEVEDEDGDEEEVVGEVDVGGHTLRRRKSNSRKKVGGVSGPKAYGTNGNNHTSTSSILGDSSDDDEEVATPSKGRQSPERVPSSGIPVNLDNVCGVVESDGVRCMGRLACGKHSVEMKRKVVGRSRPFDTLLLNVGLSGGGGGGDDAAADEVVPDDEPVVTSGRDWNTFWADLKREEEEEEEGGVDLTTTFPAKAKGKSKAADVEFFVDEDGAIVLD